MNGLIAIPIYNEVANILSVVKNLKSKFPTKNLLFIDDGSKDESYRILEKERVNYLRHPFNLGYEETLKTAMEYVMLHDFDFISFFDADGQHRVEDLEKIVSVFQKSKYDLIIGSRYKGQRKHQLSLRLVGTKVFSVLASLLSGEKITEVTCGLKLISRSYIPSALSLPAEDMHAELIVGLSRLGARVHEEEITVLPREEGESMNCLNKVLLYPAKTLLCLLGGYVIKKEDRKGIINEYTE